MCAVALRRAVRPLSPASTTGAERAEFPGYIKSCDPSLRDRPPKGDWLYEIKGDGYRIEALLTRGKATLYSRARLDWTQKFSEIAEALKQLPARQAVIDGEAIVLGKRGLPDFQALLRNRGSS